MFNKNNLSKFLILLFYEIVKTSNFKKNNYQYLYIVSKLKKAFIITVESLLKRKVASVI